MSVENSENSSEYRETSSRDSDYEDGSEEAEHDYSFRNSGGFAELYYELRDDESDEKASAEEAEDPTDDAPSPKDAFTRAEVDRENEEDPTTETQQRARGNSRRKTIYELDSYSTLTPSSRDAEIREEDVGTAPLARFSKSLGIPGVARVNLSALSQKILDCVVDENVTTEYPWIYVRKEIVEDNIDLHSESSDFLAIKDELQQYPDSRLLLGYAPTAENSQTGEAEFYVCLTEESRDAVARRIEALRHEQQQRVRSAVLKEPRPWHDHGSAAAVDQLSLKRSRPLLEVEVESTLDKPKAPSILTDRGCDDQRDGYVEILPGREDFDNVTRFFVDKACAAAPTTAEDSAQTEISMRVNAWCQSSPDRGVEPMAAGSASSRAKKLQSFIQSRAEQVFKETEANATWDVYANDYAKLAEAAASAMSESIDELHYKEQQSYYEGKLCGGKVINDLAWHPQWTGLFAAAYTAASKSENLVGPKPPDPDGVRPSHILVWSFDDCLRPKLLLESESQVTSVSFCPRDGSVLVGGCANGQIVVWDITGRIEELERVVVQTAAEAKYASVVRSLGTWMRETLDPALVRPTASSSLQHGQKGAITKIEWLSAYSKLDDRGRLHELPADTAEADLSLQFVASSEDGSIAFWDLSWRPPAEKKGESRSRKRKTVEKPQSLVQSISPYKILDGAFKPLYILIVQQANQTRNAVVTTMSLGRADLSKVQLEPRPRDDDPVTKRRHFKVSLEKGEEEYRLVISDRIFVGTAAGECGLVSWEGYDFSTGISLNKEICKWTWRKQLHDGPVSHAVRSRHLKDVLLTVGGRIFAVWREDAEDPIIWRKSEFRYTAGCWDGSKPTVIILGRNDGTVEIWDVFNKSHEPNITQSLSGRIITGIYAHELPLNPPCVGFCDYNGAFRTFLATKVLSASSGDSDVKWMRQFVDREVNRIKDFNTWQKNWNEANVGEYSGEKASEPERENAHKQPEADSQAKLEAAKSSKVKRRKQLIEEMQARWVRREVERMQTAVLEKKGLRGEELERRREPVLKMKQEARDKEARRQAVIGRAAELFEDALLSNFPPQQGKRLLTVAAAAVSKTTKKPSATGNLISLHTPDTGDHVSGTAHEKVIGEYEQIEAEALSRMRRRSGELDFSWRKLINEGLLRRRSMDVNLKMHKIKVNDDDDEKDSILSILESFEDP
ncbi:WD repeat-containing protein 63-like isoform X1 [Nasonia vitripennis]|uniref:WD repeat-containing protein 63 n=1 Tax=Nasonia vitripennis TaxID=7425 RepID=A0A7M7H7M9_NASVI|nr:WD repeat-containing protein 63-like isoform X1 [Nasonia vitripennis]